MTAGSDLVDVTLRFEDRGGGVWVAVSDSVWGPVEVVVNGSDERPDEADLLAVEDFLKSAHARVLALRRRIRFGFLFAPIRIADNRHHVVGVQFQGPSLLGGRRMVMEEPKAP